ncbi:hypothetical protein V8D89_014381 [Ganoderma adspersum]
MDPRHTSSERDEVSSQTGTVQHESPTSPAKPKEFMGCTKDTEYWHEDGDVVLLVEDVAFRLHAPRLAGYCGYFHTLFSGPGRLGAIALTGEAKGCRVYLVTLKLCLLSFKNVLKVLHSPLYVHTPSFTEHSHRKYQDGARLTAFSWQRHRSAIEVGRKYGMPGVLKRAFYELLSSQTFGDMLESAASHHSAIDKLSIAEEDARRLLAARLKLGRLWRKFIMESPSGAWRVSDKDPRSTYRCCHARDSKETRAGKWRNFVCERGLLEVDDPIRLDLVKEWRNVDEGEGWCHGCLDSKRRAWEEKRAEWWNEMDVWFGL